MRRRERVTEEHDSRETAIEYLKEIVEGKGRDLEGQIRQEREEMKMQMEMLKELMTGERERREEAVERLREEQDSQEKVAKERLERLENESREFFGKMETYLEGGVGRVQEEVEVFRKQLMAESEKVAELVRKEIEARFSSDV